MIIAVASGKGGTGKTTISVALSQALNEKVQLLDCDVEEPNAGLFLNLRNIKEQKVEVPVPIVNNNKCTFCGKCQDICQFNAITVLKDKVLVFDDLCHSCGGCEKVCPENAISEIGKEIGTVSSALTHSLSFVQGKLDIGRAMSPPLIRAVKARIDEDVINIIDCPPGNSCPVITAVNGADYVILVTEASPFGLYDLTLSVDTIREISIPFGVIINKASQQYPKVNEYCANENIPVLLEIEESIEVARTYSNGGTLLDALPQLKDKLQNIVNDIMEARV